MAEQRPSAGDTRVYSRAARPAARLHRHVRSRSSHSRLPSPLARYAADADLTDEHLSALVLWLVFGSAISLMAWPLAGAPPSVVVGVVVVVVPAVLGRRWAGRRLRRHISALPDVVDMIGRSLRSGASLAQALDEAAVDGPAAIGTELRLVVGGIHRGQSAAKALQTWVERVPRPEVRIVAAALALASRNESGTTQALDGVSHSLRDRAALTAEIRSHSAQAAASMQALVLMPIAFLGVDVLGNQETLRFLLAEPVGRACLVAAVVLDLAGWFWMTRIIRRRSPQ